MTKTTITAVNIYCPSAKPCFQASHVLLNALKYLHFTNEKTKAQQEKVT